MPAKARTARVVSAVGLIAACVFGAARRLGDFDLPWHLATGRQIVLQRSIPAVDDLSYSFRGAPLRGEYLSDLLLYAAERAGGTHALHLIALVVIAAIALLLVLRAGSGQRLAGMALAALGLVAAGPWLVMRPALMSFGMLAAVLWVIDRAQAQAQAQAHDHAHDHDQAGSGGSRWLGALAPLQMAWANMHGLAALGALIAVGYGVYRIACRLARGRCGGLLPVEDGQGAAAALGWGVLAAAATCVSSYGWRIVANPLLLRRYSHSIAEWTPTTVDFVLRYDPLFGLLVVAALAALLVPTQRSRLPSLFEVALVLGSLALAISAVRLIAVFAVISAPIVARRIGPHLEPLRAGRVLCVLSALCASPGLLMAPGARPGLGWDGENLPIGAVEFARQHGLRGPVWNFLPFGGWIEWRMYPEVRAYIDGRTGWLYPPDFVEGYFRAQRDPAAFAALQQKDGFSWALVRARPGEHFDAPLAADPAFRMVYLDDSAAVYVRRGGPDDARAGEGYLALRHDEELRWLTMPLDEVRARLGGIEPLRHDNELLHRQAPDSPRTHALSGLSSLLNGNCVSAWRALSALRKTPQYAGWPLLARAINTYCPAPSSTR